MSFREAREVGSSIASIVFVAAIIAAFVGLFGYVLYEIVNENKDKTIRRCRYQIDGVVYDCKQPRYAGHCGVFLNCKGDQQFNCVTNAKEFACYDEEIK